MTVSNTHIDGLTELKQHLAQSTIDAIAQANAQGLVLTDSQLDIIVRNEQRICEQMIAAELAVEDSNIIKRSAFYALPLATLLVIHAIQSNALSGQQYIREAVGMAFVYLIIAIVYAKRNGDKPIG